MAMLRDFYCEKCDEVFADLLVKNNWMKIRCDNCKVLFDWEDED